MKSNKYHLAQFNFARALAPLHDPIMEGFISQLKYINGLADAAPGFVWRLQTEDGDATGIRAYPEDERLLITLSVWESVETLFEFTYRQHHAEMMRNRRDWFEHIEEHYIVLWWVLAGHIPSIDEAKERLEYLRCHGVTPQAFTFHSRFPIPEESH